MIKRRLHFRDALARRLHAIPHLNLTDRLPAAPVRDLQREFMQFCDRFEPYDFRGDDPEKTTYLRTSYLVLPIIDQPAPQFVQGVRPTPELSKFGAHMPTTLEWLHSFSATPQKVRVTLLESGRELPWHSHSEAISLRPDDSPYLFMHIPLVTAPGVRFGVRDTRDPSKIYWQHYGVGEAWVFNSYHCHNAVNDGAAKRYHLLAFIPLRDELFLPLVRSAIEDFPGELLEDAD
jgi:hypothetical protein